jgi:hypothetical protein
MVEQEKRTTTERREREKRERERWWFLGKMVRKRRVAVKERE